MLRDERSTKAGDGESGDVAAGKVSFVLLIRGNPVERTQTDGHERGGGRGQRRRVKFDARSKESTSKIKYQELCSAGR